MTRLRKYKWNSLHYFIQCSNVIRNFKLTSIVSQLSAFKIFSHSLQASVHVMRITSQNLIVKRIHWLINTEEKRCHRKLNYAALRRCSFRLNTTRRVNSRRFPRLYGRLSPWRTCIFHKDLSAPRIWSKWGRQLLTSTTAPRQRPKYKYACKFPFQELKSFTLNFHSPLNSNL